MMRAGRDDQQRGPQAELVSQQAGQVRQRAAAQQRDDEGDAEGRAGQLAVDLADRPEDDREARRQAEADQEEAEHRLRLSLAREEREGAHRGERHERAQHQSR